GLVLHVACEGNFDDRSDLNNDGTQHGGVSITHGVKGRACGFDGIDDRILISDLGINGSNNVTISLWAKADACPDTNMIASDESSGQNGFGFNSDCSVLIFKGDDSASANASQWSITGDIYEWNHYVGLSNSTGLYIFVNGVLEAQNTGSFIPVDIDSLYEIGHARSRADRYFNGSIDEVRIYNRSLTSTEILSLYNSSKSYHMELWTTPREGLTTDSSDVPDTSDSTGLVGWWKLNGDATDSSGEGNDGTLIDYNLSNYDGNTTAREVTGRWNQAYYFDGADDYMDADTINAELNSYNGTISLWTKKAEDNSLYVLSSNLNYRTYIRAQSGEIDFVKGNPSATIDYTSAEVNQWYHLVLTWGNETGGANLTMRAYVNGDLIGFKNFSSTAGSSRFFFGSFAGKNQWYNGTIDEIKVYNRTLSPTEIKDLYKKGVLVGHWTFDSKDGSDSSYALDVSGYENNGTVTDAIFTNEGKFKEAYYFDGVNSFVSLPSSDSLNVSENDNYSFGIWFKLDSSSYQDDEYLFEKWATPTSGKPYPAVLRTNIVDGEVRAYFAVYNGSVGANAYTPVGTDLNDSQWHYIVGVKNATHISTYLDGVFSADYGLPGGQLYNDDDWYLGSRGNTDVNRLHGWIDEFKIYSRALTSTEIAGLYNGTKTNHLELWTTPTQGILADETDYPETSDSSGLVGWWKLNDLTNGNTTDEHIADGTENNGSVIGATFTNEGRWQEAFETDGTSSQYIQLQNQYNFTHFCAVHGGFSLGFWWYLRSDGSRGGFFQRDGSPFNGITLGKGSSGAVSVGVTDSSGNNANVVGSGQKLNQWSHLFMTYNCTANTTKLYIDGELDGTTTNNAVTNNFGEPHAYGPLLNNRDLTAGADAIIDEVRIYNRSLSEDEIKDLYMEGVLVGHWTMDSEDGSNRTVAEDISGYENDGSGNADTIFTNEGKFKEGYSFDGTTNGEIGISDSPPVNITGNITVSAWIYPKSLGGAAIYRGIVEKKDSNLYASEGYILNIDSNGNARFNIGNGTTGANADVSVSTNEWAHITGVYNGTGAYIYKNGILSGSDTTNVPTLEPTTSGVRIGRWDGQEIFNGSIDDVRIYSRALTSTEVAGLYNGTKTNRISIWSIPG
ncbi:hypothetical protein GF358_03520, partial [Candidatus Woesearchaeota archaeon]|nr:hypothetical protein [Candidatus Woesearchaeota archaeon]